MLGIIAIPGMMTGAILGGSSVDQAAKLQMIIMFMISSSTALASIITTCLTLGMVIDGDHRIRSDRIDAREHPIYRGGNWVLGKIGAGLWIVVSPIMRRVKSMYNRREGGDGERQPLLS